MVASEAHLAEVNCLAFNPNNPNILATGSADKTVRALARLQRRMGLCRVAPRRRASVSAASFPGGLRTRWAPFEHPCFVPASSTWRALIAVPLLPLLAAGLRRRAQVALHDWRNMGQRLHVFESHTDEVFAVSEAGRGGVPWGVTSRLGEPGRCHRPTSEGQFVSEGAASWPAL